jgi:hypothetical protein
MLEVWSKAILVSSAAFSTVILYSVLKLKFVENSCNVSVGNTDYIAPIASIMYEKLICRTC